MATINYLTTVQFDHGAVKLGGAECKRLGITRPLVVTDRGIRASGLLDRVLRHLEGAAHAVYDATPANPTEGAVLEALDAYRRHDANGLVALGGGSSLDLGKAVRCLINYARENPDRHGEIFDEIRCLDC